MWATVAGLQYEISQLVGPRVHVYLLSILIRRQISLRLAAGNLVRAVYEYYLGSIVKESADSFDSSGSVD